MLERLLRLARLLFARLFARLLFARLFARLLFARLLFAKLFTLWPKQFEVDENELDEDLVLFVEVLVETGELSEEDACRPTRLVIESNLLASNLSNLLPSNLLFSNLFGSNLSNLAELFSQEFRKLLLFRGLSGIVGEQYASLFSELLEDEFGGNLDEPSAKHKLDEGKALLRLLVLQRRLSCSTPADFCRLKAPEFEANTAADC